MKRFRLYVKFLVFKLTWKKRLCKNCSNLTLVSNYSPCYSCKLASNFEYCRHGEWIRTSAGDYQCSLCGRYKEDDTPYCNCGANMDRGNDNNKDFVTISKMGAILQTKKATKKEVMEAYKNSNLMRRKMYGKDGAE